MERFRLFQIPQRYRFSSKSQPAGNRPSAKFVVLDTTKVQIFKQITTNSAFAVTSNGCFRYHKGTDFQANHNFGRCCVASNSVVLDTTKVQIFKQITTWYCFSCSVWSCFRYHKGTDFQANHNGYSDDSFTYKLFQIPQRYRFSSKSQPVRRL